MREFPTKTSQISLKHYSKDIFIKFSRTENHAHLKASNFHNFYCFSHSPAAHMRHHPCKCDRYVFLSLSLLTAACRKSNFSFFFLQFIFFLYMERKWSKGGGRKCRNDPLAIRLSRGGFFLFFSSHFYL